MAKEKKESITEEAQAPDEVASDLPTIDRRKEHYDPPQTDKPEQTPGIAEAMQSTTESVASMDVLKPVLSRLRTRLNEIKELSSAKSSKIMRGNVPVWTTIKPKMFISGLESMMRNGVGIITYHTYELDEKGNKKYYTQKTKMRLAQGELREVETGGFYKQDALVVETIERNKPLRRELFKPAQEG